MAQASLEKLVKKLDEVEAKLNRIEAKLAGGSGAGAGAAPAAGGASVDAWDALVSAHITKFIEDSKKIADDVGQIVRFCRHFLCLLKFGLSHVHLVAMSANSGQYLHVICFGTCQFAVNAQSGDKSAEWKKPI